MVENKYKVKDEALFAAVQNLKDGADGDYNLLYELSEKYIYKIINDIVKNHHTTEDLMQETYLQIYNKIDTLQDARAFYVWAGRIATNLTLRHVQKYRKETLAVADEEGSTDFVFDVATDDNECFIPENVLMDKEKQRLIAEIIDNLSIEQKLSVQYFYYEEMSVRDIAQVMGCSEGTVKSRLNYARKSIKDAVIDLDVKQGTRLYSLGTMPLFWLVFRESVEAFVIAGATSVAGVAGSVAGAVGGTSSVGTAGAVAGSVGSAGTGMAGTVAGGAGSVGTGGGIAGTVASVGNAGATSVAGGAVGGGAGAVGTAGGVSVAGSAGATASVGASVAAGSAASTAATAGSAATAGTVASTGATAGSAASTGAATGATKAATGLGAKFFGTATGKAVAGVAAAAVVIGGGVAMMNGGQESKSTADSDTVVSVTQETGTTEGSKAVEGAETTQEPEITKLPDGIANKLSIEYSYNFDINNKEYWETYTNRTSLYVGLYPGGNEYSKDYVIGEYSYISGDYLSPEITAFFDLYAPEEEARIFFAENQDIAATRKGVYSVNVTEDFPETLEFDFDGMHFVADISKVTKNLTFTTNAYEGHPAYTSSYSSEYNGEVEDWYAYAVDFQIDATFTCDGNILESQYAKDKEGTYLHGEPSLVYEVNDRISIWYYYRCDPREQNYLDGEYDGGIIGIGDYVIGRMSEGAFYPGGGSVIDEHFIESTWPEYDDAPEGLLEVFNAYMPEEQVQAFFETYQYISAKNKQEYWEDVSAVFPKTLEFDYEGMHFVMNVQDVQRFVQFVSYSSDGPYYTASYMEEEFGEMVTTYASSVGFYLEGTYTCDKDITASPYARDKDGNYVHGNPGETAP